MGEDCSTGLFSLTPCELTSLATAISLLLSEGVDGCQRPALGNFVLSIGQNILTYDAQATCLNK
jgi:hypothetical protein